MKNIFLDATGGNHYLEGHDVVLLSCRSNEFIKKIHTASSLIGFGNIISSIQELEIPNLAKPEPKRKNSTFVKWNY